MRDTGEVHTHNIHSIQVIEIRIQCNVSIGILSEVYRAQHSAQYTADPPTYLYRYSLDVNRLNLQGVKGVCMCIDCTIILHDFLPKHV